MRNNPDTTRGTAASTRGTTGSTRLTSLNDIDDYKLADGEPDIRGWDVKATDGQKVGEVEDLLFDPGLMKVRYIEMKLDKKFAANDDRRRALIPIGAARLDDDQDDVLVNIASTDLAGMPPYTRGDLTRDYENALLQRYGRGAPATTEGTTDKTDFYGTDHFDENRAFAGRRAKRDRPKKGDERYLTRAEEELTIGKRKVEAGSVGVSKHFETEHVRESVPVKREEVTVERRPIRGDADTRTRDARIEDDEIRVPVMEEEVVAGKRAVAKEEVVIRKDVVEDEKVIEADLRKERLDIDRDDDRSTHRKSR